MVKFKNELIALAIGLIIGIIVMYSLRKPEIVEVKVPFKVEVEVPVIEKEYDTIYTPVPEYTVLVDSSLVEEYKKANDSLKEALYNSAVTVREYEEVFEDSTITITVGANVTGKLNSLVAKYKTKPRVIVLDTTLSVEVPNYRRGITFYGELGVPTPKGVEMPPVLKGGFDITNKNNWVWGASYDTEKRVWVKLGKKFNF
jgi:hypothetical protein